MALSLMLMTMTEPNERVDPRQLLVASRVRRLEGAEPPHLDPTLARVRRGYFRPAGLDLSISDNHRLRIFATAEAREAGQIFSHASAAELWGSPQLKSELEHVHLTRPGVARRTTAKVKVHRGRIPDDHVVEMDGLLVTSSEWTAIQVAATQPLPAVLLPLDYLFGAIAAERGLSHDEVLALLLALIPPRMKGGARAERQLKLADPRSGSAGESLSRGQMVRLGVPMPDLQVPFARGDEFGDDIVDFDWPELGVFGEYDGMVKYVRAEFTRGRTPEQVLWDEKRREDRIRKHRPRGARWGWSDAMSLDRLRNVLAAAGVRPLLEVSR